MDLAEINWTGHTKLDNTGKSKAMWIDFSWIVLVLTDVSVRFTCRYSSLPHPIMHIQSNLRPTGVIDGAPLIWPRHTSASRFTTVATGRFGTGSGKNTGTQLHSLVSLSPFHSHSCTIMRMWMLMWMQNKYVQYFLSLFVYQHNRSTQNMNMRHATFTHTYS